MSTLSIGSLNQLGDALESAGWTAEDVTKLKQFKFLNGIKAIIRGKAEIVYPPKKYRDEEGVVYFQLTSDGTTGEEWIKFLEDESIYTTDQSKKLLLSKYFKPTTGITYEIAVLKGSLIAKDSGGIAIDGKHVTERICQEVKKHELVAPHPEVACLIHKKFSFEELRTMGLSQIATMHDPIEGSDGSLLIFDRDYRASNTYLRTQYTWDHIGFFKGYGFAFEIQQCFMSRLDSVSR